MQCLVAESDPAATPLRPLAFAQPDAAWELAGGCGEGFADQLWLAVPEPCVEQLDAECAVERQECPQQVCLGPATALAEPAFGVFEGPEDVVDVDEDAVGEAGEDFEEQQVDVAAGFADVGGVDEQDVAGV